MCSQGEQPSAGSRVLIKASAWEGVMSRLYGYSDSFPSCWWLWIHGGRGKREDQSGLELWDVLGVGIWHRRVVVTDRAEPRPEWRIPRSPVTLSH